MVRFINVLLILMLIGFIKLFSAVDSVQTDEIVVTASRIPTLYSENARIIQIINRQQIESAPVQSLAEILEYNASVDVRQRGIYGVQSDISIRGGTFDQVLILLNGIPVNDPQTGHHNMNLPIDMYDIDRIEILEGPGSRVLGVNAFTGAINIITSAESESKFRLNLNGGEYGMYRTFSSLNYNSDVVSAYLSASKSASDGYIDNTDFDILTVFSQIGVKTTIADFSLQAGYNKKDFGANSFYTALYPNQFEAVKNIFTSLSFTSGKEINLTGNIYNRINYDRFELFRNNPESWYTSHNYHKTNLFGGLLNFNFEWLAGKSGIGTDLRSEIIYSNVLGELMDSPIAVDGENNAFYTRKASRENAGFFADHTIAYEKLTASAGLYFNWNSDWNWNTYFGIDLNYKFDNNISVFANVNQSTRLPNFTDLYYSGPTNVGNPLLIPENAMSYEAGMKYFEENFKLSASVFTRFGKNLIDWTRISDTLLWQAMNITEVTTTGFSISGSIYPSRTIDVLKLISSVDFSYTYLNSEKESGNFLSYYNLDHLKHKLVLGTKLSFFENFETDIKYSYQSRIGTFYNYKVNAEIPYEDISLLDLKLIYNYDNFRFYGEVSNILDVIYQDLGNVYLPGRWARFGIEFKTGLGL